MASAATKPAKGTRGHRAESHSPDHVRPTRLVIPGCSNLTCGIPAITHPHPLTAHAQHTTANPRTQGWTTPITSMLQLRSNAARR
jgi:hypothetical protein